MTHKSKPSFIAWRFYLLLSIVAIAALGLGWRVFDLAILDQHFLRHQGDERTLRLVSTPAFRGMIVDRNGSPLAVSTRVYSIWMNPQEFAPSLDEAKQLAKLLKISTGKIYGLIERDKKRKREFTYLKRGQDPAIAARIKALHIHGLHQTEEYRRFYPEGEVMAHVIGFTNIDDKGQEGLELGYNDWLEGDPGKKWVIKDRLGRIISDVRNVQDQKPGNDLVLSLDRRIQYLAYRELLKAVEENKAAYGSAVVLDAKTGEVLAMANAPSYNPNVRPKKLSAVLRNRALTDTFEPGSTIKPFAAALALQTKKYSPESIINTYPGWIRLDRNVVKDHRNNKELTLTEIIKKSSNVGIAKVVLSLNPDDFWALLSNVGFGDYSGLDFPGEQMGSLVRHHPWGDFVLATLAMGYGLSVNTMQLAHAYTVLANQGVQPPISLLRRESVPEGRRILSKDVAHQVMDMMEEVFTKGGTAQRISVPGYHVAGKTGTAKLAGEGGYQKHRYTASIVGAAPLSDPRVVIAVVIYDPQGKRYYGASVSGPVFSRIMEGTLRILDVSPDNLESAKTIL